ncbi:MAG TPA: DNA mismatch repair protein MutS [Chloroflexota bacterium]|jgi:DNA mismatch repair protein MutS|nr:DNA mismatch repair protein MutS [Chloroflexota bacterium]
MDGPPIWQQYQRLKRQHPGALLLFRLGDFYETFDEDAETLARELEIVLTSRELGRGSRHALAGIPHQALESHLARLVARGHRVAICEQLTDPATARGLVERAIVRVVTPGTVVEPGLLEAKANNYLAALVLAPHGAGIAHLDVTTGEFACCQIDGDAARARRRDDGGSAELVRRVVHELERLAPAELIVPAADPRAGPPTDLPAEIASRFQVTPFDAWRFSDDPAREKLRAHYGTGTLEPFGCADRPLAAGAAGAVLQYVGEAMPGALGHVAPLRTYDLSGFMALDPATRRSLELTSGTRSGTLQGSLLGVLDRTRTAMGGRALRAWLARPLIDRAAIEARLDAVEALHGSGFVRARLGSRLGRVADLERLLGRVVQRTALPRELHALRESLAVLPMLRDDLGELLAPGAEGSPEEGRGAAGRAAIRALLDEIGEHAAVADAIGRALVANPPPSVGEGGLIQAGYSPELDDLVERSRTAREWMATLEARERERTGLRSLRVGYNKVFGYYLEVSQAALKLPPTPELRAQADGRPLGTVQDALEGCLGYARRQTLVGAERYVTPELKEKEQLVLEAQERIAEVESRLFRELCGRVAEQREVILPTANALARLDVFLALAEVAAANRYVRPRVSEDATIEIVAGRHPVVEVGPLEAGFVPNDTRLSCDAEQIVIVTGPNMAGKSTYLRQVGLIVLMAQIGSFVPAEEATIGLVDRVFTRVGAQDDIATGQSTFMVEMAETAAILNHATRRSLLILDEIGRGTSTFDGMAIARAIVEHIHDHPRLGCRTLFATHYHELTDLARTLARVRNARVDVLEEGDRVVFLHRVVPGGADRSYGVHVASLAGIPASVVQRARELLKELERGGRRRPGRSEPTGRGLFDAPRDPLLDELAGLEPDGLTPLQALNRLYELRDRARRSP